MNVLLDSSNISSEHIHLCNLNVLLHANDLTNLKNWLVIFNFIKVWHITRVQNIVDIFKHLFIDNLSVNKQERGLFVFNSSLHKGFFDILAPVAHTVTLNDFDLE